MYEKLAELLELNQITAYRVAKDTGISSATLSNWKAGNYTPKVNKLKILADYFGVGIDYFLDFESSSDTTQEKISGGGCGFIGIGSQYR